MMNSDFSYLQIPKSLYSRQPQKSNALYQREGKTKRRFFYNVPFTTHELSEIQKFKQYAAKNNKPLECKKQEILRYLYSQQFNYKDALEKINIFIQWIHNPVIQNISSRTQNILNQGVIYTLGRDKNQRPIIYLNISEIDLQKYTLDDYYSAINAVLTVVTQYLFVKGVIESYLFVIDMGGKNFTSLPLDAILNIVKKLTVVYSMYLGSMLVINTNFIIKLSYAAVKKIIHPETARKITLLGVDQLHQMTQFVDEDQLEKRHSGMLDNLPVYWPPRLPNHHHDFSDNETVYFSIMEENLKFLVDEETVDTENTGGCCSNEQCNIF